MAKKEKNKALKLKKNAIAGLATWLYGLSLSGRQSRERTRFAGILAKAVQEFEKERKEIIEKYVVKEIKPDGKEEWKRTGDNWVIDDAKDAEFQKEMLELINESFILDVTEANKENLQIVSRLIMDTDYKFGPVEGDDAVQRQAKIALANDYANWCDAFEALELEA